MKHSQAKYLLLMLTCELMLLLRSGDVFVFANIKLQDWTKLLDLIVPLAFVLQMHRDTFMLLIYMVWWKSKTQVSELYV